MTSSSLTRACSRPPRRVERAPVRDLPGVYCSWVVLGGQAAERVKSVSKGAGIKYAHGRREDPVCAGMRFCKICKHLADS